MIRYFYFTLLLAIFISCTKTIDFDDEEFANELVLNSIIRSDSDFTALIKKSTSVLTDNKTGQVTEGTLDLYENGSLLTHLVSVKGQFHAPGIKPTAGNTYRLVVTSNGKQIESVTSVPEQAEVISIDTTSGINDYGTRANSYKIKIKDRDGDDFYRIVVMNEKLFQSIDQANHTIKYYIYNTQFSIHSGDPVFKSVYNNLGDDILDMGPTNSYDIFPDDYFKGKEYSIQLNATSNYYGYGYGYGNVDTKVIYSHNTVHVQRLSMELYTYLKYLKLYSNYHENPFAEPVPVYSNVNNGTGIFAGFNDDAKFVYEDTYIPFSMDTIKVEDGYSNR